MKKWIMALLTAICGVCFALGLSACVPGGLGTHAWSEKWSHTISQHWHECDDKNCNGRSDAGDHEWELIKTFTEATCKFEGEGRYICTVCGATLDDAIPATGEHEWSVYSVDVAATCTDDGVQTEICDNCAMARVVIVPATGEHDFIGALHGDENGHYQLCANGCGTKSTYVNHTEGDPVVTQPSSFGYNDGKKEYRCIDCNYLIRTENITNPRAPTTIQVQILGADLVTSPGGKSGSVTLTLNTRYDMYLNAFTEGGTLVPTELVYMDSENGIRAYIEDPMTGVRNKIDLQNNSQVNIGMQSSTQGVKFFIEAFQPGQFLVIINFETGMVGSESHRVRVSYALEVTVTR